MRMRFFFVFIILSVMLVLLPFFAGTMVKSEVSNRLGFGLEGQVRPYLFQAKFTLKQAQFEWKEKIKFISGDLIVEYDWLEWLLSARLPFRVTGKNLKVALLGDWQLKTKSNPADIKCLDALLVLDKNGVKEIGRLNIQSDEFQFQINQAENKGSYCGGFAEDKT